MKNQKGKNRKDRILIDKSGITPGFKTFIVSTGH